MKDHDRIPLCYGLTSSWRAVMGFFQHCTTSFFVAVVVVFFKYQRHFPGNVILRDKNVPLEAFL